jgi:hypothetical protein
VRVTSQLVDMDIEVGSITWRGTSLIVQTTPGVGIDTQIEIGPREVLRILGKILRNPAVVGYVLALPLLCWRARSRKSAEPADPWSKG